MKVMIVKELMTGDVSPVAMFSSSSFFSEIKQLLWSLDWQIEQFI